MPKVGYGLVHMTRFFNRPDPTDVRRQEKYGAMKDRMQKRLEERKKKLN